MAGSSKTFSESWYRIAGQTISLKSSVAAHRQFFRGEKWYVLRDPYNNRFYRLRPAAYDFVIRLREGIPVEDVWKECLELQGEDAPGQDEVIRILSGLYHAGLLQYQSNSDSVVLFKRLKKEQSRELKAKLLGFMFPKIPLYDPDRFLEATLPYVGKLISRWGALLWCIVFFAGVKALLDNFEDAVGQAQGILAPSNLFWLYICLVGIKLLHEFGHAYACRLGGGEVHHMGVMFLIFTPLPYVDATSSWAFRSRLHRMGVSLAGVVVELFIAAVAAIVWAATGAGLMHSISYNVMFLASVSTLLFNMNPLLRFDGYYVLSDYLDIPNLHDRARREMYYVVKRFGFGITREQSIARTGREARLLIGFFVLSNIYRIIIFSSIILFVAGQLMVVGVILALFFILSWLIVPFAKFIHYLMVSPDLTRIRGRAVAVSLGAGLVLFVALRLIPFPCSFQAPGVLEASTHKQIYVQTPACLKAVYYDPGAFVRQGDRIMEFHNPELELELELIRAKIEETEARRLKAMQNSTSDVDSYTALLESVERQRERLLEMQEYMVITSPYDGIWSGDDLIDYLGCWFGKGMQLGAIVSEDRYEFSAVVSQSEAARLFKDNIRRVNVKLQGQGGSAIEISSFEKIPVSHKTLPSSVLGFLGGGEIATELTDPSGTHATEPFFRVVAHVVPSDEVVMKHGIPGRIRFQLPYEPMLTRWMRSFSQMLQKKYRI